MKRIMLVLLRTLGDVVLVNTLVESIKNYYGQDTHLTVYVNKEWRDIVGNNPKIDELRADKEWHKNFNEIHLDMIAGDYDEVLIPQQTTPDDNAWHQYPESRNQHLYDFYLKRCRIPKGPWVDRKLRMYHTEVDVKTMRVNTEQIPEGGSTIVIHCKSGNVGKDISASQWQEIIRAFYPMGWRFVQVGHQDDTSAISGMEAELPEGVFYDLRGALSFNELAAFIQERADVFMGLDSGISYVAASTGKPTFVWYGCTIPLTSGPWGENVHFFVSKECKTAQDRLHTRCHAQCGAKPNCIQLFDVKAAIQYAKDRIIPQETAKA